jgi:hypothetical protein
LWFDAQTADAAVATDRAILISAWSVEYRFVGPISIGKLRPDKVADGWTFIDENLARRAVGALATLLIVCAGASVHAQQCPYYPACSAVFGSVAIPALSTDADTRILRAEEYSPDGLFMDEIIGLSFNRSWNPATGFARDDPSQPSTWMGLESYWNGSAELNVDIAPANSAGFLRPLGFDAAYNGSVTQLQVGGPPYTPGAAGVTLQGGAGRLLSLLTIRDQPGRSSYANMIDMQRADGTDSFVWRASGTPRLNFALQNNFNATGFGNFGVMKFAGEWDYGEPIFDFEAVGVSAILVRSLPVATDSSSRFRLLADGTQAWGPGNAPVDTNLYRSAVGTIRTDGNLVVGGNLTVMGQKAALVKTASYGQREVYAVESPEEWFEDFGNSTLKGNTKIIRLDPIFRETVISDRQYHVFLTPNGGCTLYVARKRPGYFTVKRLLGRGECGFDYRIVAKRRGYGDVRLAQFSH